MTQRYYPGLQQTSNMKSFASILEDSEVLLHKCLWWVLDTPLLTLFERYYSLTLFIKFYSVQNEEIQKLSVSFVTNTLLDII